MELPLLRYIYFWPDGTWVDKEEYNLADWAHKSDDYGLIVLPLGTPDEEVDRIALGGNSHQSSDVV
jgi:hypothetical protein